MTEDFKSAVLKSVTIPPDTVVERLNIIVDYGMQITRDNNISETDTDKEKDLKAQMNMLKIIDKAEELGMSEAEFLVMLLMMSQG